MIDFCILLYNRIHLYNFLLIENNALYILYIYILNILTLQICCSKNNNI